MAILFDRFSMSFSKQKETLPSDVQKFYLLPQAWEKYQKKYMDKLGEVK